MSWEMSPNNLQMNLQTVYLHIGQQFIKQSSSLLHGSLGLKQRWISETRMISIFGWSFKFVNYK